MCVCVEGRPGLGKSYFDGSGGFETVLPIYSSKNTTLVRRCILENIDFLLLTPRGVRNCLTDLLTRVRPCGVRSLGRSFLRFFCLLVRSFPRSFVLVAFVRWFVRSFVYFFCLFVGWLVPSFIRFCGVRSLVVECPGLSWSVVVCRGVSWVRPN